MSNCTKFALWAKKGKKARAHRLQERCNIRAVHLPLGNRPICMANLSIDLVTETRTLPGQLRTPGVCGRVASRFTRYLPNRAASLLPGSLFNLRIVSGLLRFVVPLKQGGSLAPELLGSNGPAKVYHRFLRNEKSWG